jgi:hypothetical protein
MENKVIISLDEYDSMREIIKTLDVLRSSVNIKETHIPERGFEMYRIISVRKKDLLKFFDKLSSLSTDDTYDDIELL